MGEISVSRCRVCHGRGEIGLDTLPEVLLYEWMEGYIDDDTDDKWLKDQLTKLIDIRAKRRAALALGSNPDADDYDYDADDEDDI